MKEIQLTQGKVALVDDEDFERVNQFKWYASKANTGKFYAARLPYPLRHKIYMAREVINAPGGMEVDHINGDTLDNRRSNLRLCTHAENSYNYSRRNNAYKGVSRRNRFGKWQARIQFNGKEIYLGSYLTAEDAARAHDQKARELHSEFAYLNFKE